MVRNFEASFNELKSTEQLVQAKLSSIEGVESSTATERIDVRAEKMRVGAFVTATAAFFEGLEVDEFSPPEIIIYATSLHNYSIKLPHSISQPYPPANEVVNAFGRMHPGEPIVLKDYIPSTGIIASQPELRVTEFGPYRVPYANVLFDMQTRHERTPLHVTTDFDAIAHAHIGN